MQRGRGRSCCTPPCLQSCCKDPTARGVSWGLNLCAWRHSHSVRRHGRHKRFNNASCRDPLARCGQDAGTHWLKDVTHRKAKVVLCRPWASRSSSWGRGVGSALPVLCSVSVTVGRFGLAGSFALALLAGVLGGSGFFVSVFSVASETDRGTDPRTGKF